MKNTDTCLWCGKKLTWFVRTFKGNNLFCSQNCCELYCLDKFDLL